MSNSCLLRFLCQNLFQGAIFCSLKQWSICISIQRVTVTNGLSQCFMELTCQFASSFPRLSTQSYLSHLHLPISLHQKGVFLSLALLHKQQEPWKHPGPTTRRSRNLRACDKSAAAFFRSSADGSCKHGNPGGWKHWLPKLLPLGLP